MNEKTILIFLKISFTFYNSQLQIILRTSPLKNPTFRHSERGYQKIKNKKTIKNQMKRNKINNKKNKIVITIKKKSN